jgi:hypothetical protein
MKPFLRNKGRGLDLENGDLNLGFNTLCLRRQSGAHLENSNEQFDT